jgi:dTDP-4-dehydrorhamnose 3,5-epimerase
MPPIFHETPIADVQLIEPTAFGDDRGRFVETYRREWLPKGREMILADLRVGSPTELATMAVDLDGEQERGLFIPPGVAHGFAALTDLLLWYLVDGYYNPDDELGVAFDDPDLGVDWGLTDPVVSDRDRSNPTVEAIPEALRPRWGLRT